MSERLSDEQRAILEVVRGFGYVKKYADWKSGRVHVTSGRGHSFDPRSFNGLVKRGLIVRDPDDPGLSHAGTRYILGEQQ